MSYDSEVIWERLQELIGSNNNVFKVKDILDSIAKSRVDDPIFRNVPVGKLIVSNIHKSKGREYDTVILEQKFINRLINESKSIKSVPEYIQEAKTLYVAITRPRTNLYINSLATTDVALKRISTGRKRWARGDGSNLKILEVRALTDADIFSFDTVDIQKYIIDNVFVGDEIKLVMDNNSMIVAYDIIHISQNGERKIGRVTNEFIDDVDAIISPYESPWPKRISDIYVSGIHSQISNNREHVWCWIDFCGLGQCQSESY